MSLDKETDGVEMMKVRVSPDGRVSKKDAGKILNGRSAKTLDNWKSKGWGPKPIKIGGRDSYDYRECLAMARGEIPIKPIAA